MPDMARYDPFSPTFDHPLINSSPDYGSRNCSFLSTRVIGDINGMSPQLSHREQFKRLRNCEDEKNQLIEDLMYQLENTQSRLDRLQLDFSRESAYNREGRLRENLLQEQIDAAKDIMARNPSILVLLDGNNMVFTKDLLSKGEKGGQEAASLMFEAISVFIAEQLHHLESPRIVVRIYANFKTLSDTLAKSKIIERPGVFDEFVRGLNSSQPLFDLVDAGCNTRDKVIECFVASSTDCHCQHIILGCSGDERYTKFLAESKEHYDLNHLSLLESVPFDKDLAALTDGISTIKFDKVFRNTRLAAAPAMPKGPLQAVCAQLPALARVESNETTGTTSSTTTPVLTWASLAGQTVVAAPKAVVAVRAPTPSRTPETITATLRPLPVKGIDRNRLGQRIDKVDTTIPNQEIQRIKKLKLCNIFYLQGPGYCTSNNCSHSHTYPLSKGERAVLREVARMTPCYYKMDCSDPECIYGHKCPQNKPDEKQCWYGSECRFQGWGHGVDTRVCKTTKI